MINISTNRQNLKGIKRIETNIMKTKNVKAVKPYIYKNNSNFKLAVYNAWREIGGETVAERPYEKLYKSLSYHLNLPTLFQNRCNARLRFVEAANIKFDTFPDYLLYEIIPLIWDCWPCYHNTVSEWLKRHKVKTAFFTSSQTAEIMRTLCPAINIYHLPEAIETDMYKAGKELRDRKHDYLEYGRCCDYVDTRFLAKSINILSSRGEKEVLKTRGHLIDALADSKITLCIPRSVNQPEIAQGIETLTQRYWECMLSRIIIIGKAPQELVELIGYNPVVDLDKENFAEQVKDILAHIDEYQTLVDRNRKTALELGDWKMRASVIKETLSNLNYSI